MNEEKRLTYPQIKEIASEDLEQYPIHSFNGQIHIIDNIRDAHKIAEFLLQQKVLGFDTETRPTFSKNHRNTVSLLQLSTENEAFIFQLKKMGLPEIVANILSSESIIKTGVAVRDDIKALQKLHTFVPKNFAELQTIAKTLQLDAMGLKRLTPLALGFRISKKQQLSNWENECLTEAQKLYAATDAWVSLKIYLKLSPYVQ